MSGWIARLLLAALMAVMAGTAARAECDIGVHEGACPTRHGFYRIRTPEGTGPWPAVVYLYGSLGNSARQIGDEHFVQAFVDRGYAVIVPIALDLHYKDGDGSGWALRNEHAHSERDEIGFIAEVLDDAQIRHDIDRSRVLIAGMSRGAFLTWEIACHAPRLAAAFAPVAGGYLGQMPDRCAGPVRLLATHGRSDEVVPLDDGKLWRSGGARMMPLMQSLATIARTDGCITAGQPKRFLDYDRIHWQGCAPGSSVDLLLHNGGHMVPLSWYSVVIDWFEGGRGAPNAIARTGAGDATPRFMTAGTGAAGLPAPAQPQAPGAKTPATASAAEPPATPEADGATGTTADTTAAAPAARPATAGGPRFVTVGAANSRFKRPAPSE